MNGTKQIGHARAGLLSIQLTPCGPHSLTLKEKSIRHTPFCPLLAVLSAWTFFGADTLAAPGAPAVRQLLLKACLLCLSLVVVTSPAFAGGEIWQYTTEKPAAGWETPNFDDSGWRTDPGGFGRINTPTVRSRTSWSSSDIWLRRTFEMEQLPEKPGLLIFHDEDAEVYLNGAQVSRLKGFTKDYVLVALDEVGVKALKPGCNLLAIHCRQTRGGQYIDVSVVDAATVKLPSAAAKTRSQMFLPNLTVTVKEGEAPIMTPWGERVTAENAWQEYPRPQLRRDQWQNLNGLWDYALTKDERETPTAYAGKILVPFCIESSLSGVGKRIKTEHIWYRRTFELPETWRVGLHGGPHHRLLLHFDGADWETVCWVNGQKVGTHRGGYAPFSFDITDALIRGTEQEIVVRVWDPIDGHKYPLGKQRRNRPSHYESSSGIWQTVWLEPVSAVSIERLQLTPDVDRGVLKIEPAVRGDASGCTIEVTVLDKTTEVVKKSGRATDSLELAWNQPKLWNPDRPFLYGLKARLVRNGRTLDSVDSYFAMRKIEIAPDEDGLNRIRLNGKQIFQIGPLDQSYWPESVFTPPSEEAMVWELQYLKDVGCNMVRLHITTNLDRWYYTCDRIGLLVWQDFVCGKRDSRYEDMTDDEAAEWRREQREMVDALYNHPSIVMWVVFNEAWNQHRTEDHTRWIMDYDPSRLVSVASGWQDVPSLGHIRDMHDYSTHPSIPLPATEPKRAVVLGECGGFNCIVAGHNWHGEIQPEKTDNNDWVQDIKRPRYDMGDSLTEHYAALVEDLRLLQTEGLCGAVYTQSTDMKREQNGYLTFDRRVSKIDPAKLRAIHQRIFAAPPRLHCLLGGVTGEPVEWRYVTDTPPGEWTAPEYDDASWRQGHGPFGITEGGQPALGTRLDVKRFYLRKTFDLHDLPAGAAVRVRVSGQLWDQLNLCTIHLNGQAVAIDNTRHIQAGDRVSLFNLHPEQLKMLHRGRNTLAVKVNRGEINPFLIDVTLLGVED